MSIVSLREREYGLLIPERIQRPSGYRQGLNRSGAGEEALYETRTISGNSDSASTCVGRQFLDVPPHEWFDPCAARTGCPVVYFPFHNRPTSRLVVKTREVKIR